MGCRRKMDAASMCKSITFSIQWFQIHHIITFSAIYNKVVGLSGARVSRFHALVPQLLIPVRFNHGSLTRSVPDPNIL